jgi:hypothetical protein
MAVAGALILAIGPATTPLTRAAAARKGKLTVEKVEYKGWKNNLKLSNGDAELIVTLEVGPRVLSYRLADGKNVFKEYDNQLGKSGESTWMIRGGHRLWASPEDPARTYVPDNGPVAFAELGPGAVRLTPAPEAGVGLQKEMDVKLEPSGSRVTVVHRIRNVGKAPTDVAPWALSVMNGGGVEVIPLPPKRPHPGDAKKATAADFGPDLRLALWSYTDLQDSRFHFGSRAITLRHDPHKGATKIGLSHKVGYVAYLNAGTLFVKRFDHQEGKHYPDLGVNYETFSSQDMVEMESLGPLARLAPGEAVEHTEHWELVPNVQDFKDEAELDANILSRFRAR